MLAYLLEQSCVTLGAPSEVIAANQASLRSALAGLALPQFDPALSDHVVAEMPETFCAKTYEESWLG